MLSIRQTSNKQLIYSFCSIQNEKLLNFELSGIGDLDKVIITRLTLCTLLSRFLHDFFSTTFLLVSKENSFLTTIVDKNGGYDISVYRQNNKDFPVETYNIDDVEKYNVEKFLKGSTIYIDTITKEFKIVIDSFKLENGGIGLDFTKYVHKKSKISTFGAVGVLIDDTSTIINNIGYLIVTANKQESERISELHDKIYPSRSLFSEQEFLDYFKINQVQTLDTLLIKNIYNFEFVEN